ncbi:CLUMA_CG008570, isoform A [Clunio marinus]|uniref:CLUMA_CG008570, isoform A n=1 Tax=Clunio marinus TaxID=568069 RepID=A0A1J1I684_9DIPT|nr:CLUMA_CG008570, isoform A [Clunio marinus]
MKKGLSSRKTLRSESLSNSLVLQKKTHSRRYKIYSFTFPGRKFQLHSSSIIVVNLPNIPPPAEPTLNWASVPPANSYTLPSEDATLASVMMAPPFLFTSNRISEERKNP